MGIIYRDISIFFVLIVLNSFHSNVFSKMKEKNISDWSIDLLSLTIQGIIVPVLQTLVLMNLLSNIVPNMEGSLKLPAIVSFLINFVFVDYLYYWAHRFLHHPKLWVWHRVHHSSKVMDVFVCSRNSLLTTFLLPYIWMNSIFLFLLEDKTAYITSMSITALLDAWRHSKLKLPSGVIGKFFRYFLITPIEHSTHHSKKLCQKNFAANLSIWDKIHGSYSSEESDSEDIGITVKGSFWYKFLYPGKYSRGQQ